MTNPQDSNKLHIAMYPWFALGHMTPYLHLANQLAERGHKISLILPTKTRTRLNHLNLHPNLITFIPIEVPHVEGLPLGTETTTEIPHNYVPHLINARDLTQPQIEALLITLMPNFIFFDFLNWIPALARGLGIKSIFYMAISASVNAYYNVPARKGHEHEEAKVIQHPSGFPPSPIRVHPYQIRPLLDFPKSYENAVKPMLECDALAFRTCREVEGPYCDYLMEQYGKPILLTGPVMQYGLPEASSQVLGDQFWSKWLSGFKPNSVVYCAFGSECILEKDQFQELVLGLELTGFPFLVALKPPSGAKTIEEALPDGFKERIEGRGMVHDGWVPQTKILKNPAIGCFVSHCGFGSMWEALISNCQIVFCPHFLDQFLMTDVLVGGLKVAVDVERSEENGWFKRESVCKAVKLAMDEENKIGREVMANHAKLRDFLVDASAQSSYVDEFVKELQQLAVAAK
ncbi:cyanidin 3-O-galactoside 2''-O-xylosyltransferase FGGT1-like [Telopea speciosissima]|uniref:cyanidin 3-O-galactoside 2''-O-xylosyltransferase FGGT1-like n=1 Tax=Telopea speciosissima TaxID=54955 RepID=UPI001CC413DA|nr:cyanidin 3-O-galactoside 2''-O-xylosyltransferase FGGT1-like [Telopea speciosissima]